MDFYFKIKTIKPTNLHRIRNFLISDRYTMVEYWNFLKIINKLEGVNHERKLDFYKMHPLNEMEDDYLKKTNIQDGIIMKISKT